MTVTQNEVNTAVVRLFFYIVDTSGEDVLRDEFVSKYPSINKLIITEMQNNNMFEIPFLVFLVATHVQTQILGLSLYHLSIALFLYLQIKKNVKFTIRIKAV